MTSNPDQKKRKIIINVYIQKSEVFTNSLIKRKYKQHYNRISTVQ